MTNKEFKQQIARWQKLIAQANITLANGRALPDKFFHIVLGVGESTFKQLMYGEGNSQRKVPLYTAKTLRYLSKLEPNVFLDEIRLAIPEYLNSKEGL